MSADGDCDRPLIADETGEWLQGDVLGVLCAQFLRATAVATPVSCSTVVERCGSFNCVSRTRIGSPFVIEHMQSGAGNSVVVGYEANGGFLQQRAVAYDSKVLAPLPTRDALLPIIAMLLLSKNKSNSKPLSEVAGELPPRSTASDRIKDYATEKRYPFDEPRP